MRGFLIAILTLLNFSLSAQISITRSDMPKANDTFRMSQAQISNVNALLNKKGSNSWDFSALKPISQNVRSYKSSFQTPYAFYFFNKIGLKTADSLGVGIAQFKNIYTFYTSSNSVFKAEGLGYSYNSIPLAANHIDEDEIYNLPLNYNDSHTNSFDFKFALPVGNFFTVKLTGTRTNVVDGYGSLTTPFKTYTNTLRVKTTINEIDSLITQIARLGFPRNQVIYTWLSKDERVPVLEVIGNQIGNQYTITQINYRDKYRNVGNPGFVRSNFSIDKTSGRVNLDTFSLTNLTTPFPGTSNWSITPNTFTFVNGSTATSRDPQIVFESQGVYSIKLSSTLGPLSHDTAFTNIVTIKTGNTDKLIKQSLVFPNPSFGKFQISSVGWQIYKVYNVLGKEVPYTQVSNNIELLDPKNGTYVVILKNEQGITTYEKLMVKR